MNSKNTPIKVKKIPFYLSLLLLTLGSGLILGLLSFGGMYALFPVLGLAFVSFGLSVAYEGEIYLQNIKGALNKLFKPAYLKNHLARMFLLEHFPDSTEGAPQFFKDYEGQLHILHKYEHKNLDGESQKRKKNIETKLKDMEKWFALQLFPVDLVENDIPPSHYAQEIKDWLAQHQQEEWQDKLKSRNRIFNYVKGFTILSGAFMSLGTTYLIIQAFSVIPVLAAIPFTILPFIVIPMALIAGTAYALNTYNAITDMINNDTLKKWYVRLRDDLSQGLTVRNVFLTTTAVVLVGLAIALTVFTAGTWWTVANNAQPLFEWMKKMPSFVMGIINPIITGTSALFFIGENTATSMDLISELTEPNKTPLRENIFIRAYGWVKDKVVSLQEKENLWQILNPARIIIKLTITPLRVLLFLGHLISIAMTADRMPGVPQIVAALISMISEGFEDAHYFVGHDHEDHKSSSHDTKTLLIEHLDASHGHNHDLDIPTRILKTLAMPLYFLASLWDWKFSQKNAGTSKPVLTYQTASNKQNGVPEEKTVSKSAETSDEWKVEHTLSLIEKYTTKHLDSACIDKECAQQKKSELKKIQQKISTASDKKELSAELFYAQENKVFNTHRLFNQNSKTSTQLFVEELPKRVGSSL